MVPVVKTAFVVFAGRVGLVVGRRKSNTAGNRPQDVVTACRASEEEALAEVASEFGAKFIDLTRFLSPNGAGSSPATGEDGTHLTPAGYALLAAAEL